MEHYYTAPENISAESLVISGDDAKHLAKVLRKKQGIEIFVTDGKGNLYNCIIESADKKYLTCRILNKQKDVNEPHIKLQAYIALLKNPARFEFAVEKLTELGVYEIQPVITENVISKSKNKTERWQAIALSAMKQSQRCILPAVNNPVNFKEAVIKCSSEIKLIAHEKAALTPLPALPLRQAGLPPLHMERGKDVHQQVERQGGEVALFIGPEGGFTDDEIKLAEEKGFTVFSLGARKYRSETAAVAATVLIFS